MAKQPSLRPDPEEETIGLIQGKTPDSKQEWRVAVALEKHGWEFIYQYQVFGGTTVRGGQVIDFLVMTAPLSTPIQVQGGYWHSGMMGSEDRFKQIMLETTLQNQMNKIIVIWGKDVPTQSAANNIIRRKLGINK